MSDDLNRADARTLDSIHNLLAGTLKKRLEESQKPGGDPLTAAEITAMSKFLADNDIKGQPGSARMAPIAAGLDALKEADGVADLDRYRTNRTS